MAIRSVEYKGRWIKITIPTGSENAWCFQIEAGPIVNIEADASRADEEQLFTVAERLAKERVDRELQLKKK